MTLERLEITPFANIIRDILQDRRSGVLTVVAGNVRRLVHWAYGDVVLVESARREETLGHFLRQKDLISEEAAAELEQVGSANVALHFSEVEMVPSSIRHSVLREWITSVIRGLFSLESGTAAFEEGDPLAPEQRVFLSTPALVLDGVRSIQSGLVLRSSLGDLKRVIEPEFDGPYDIETLPFTDEERTVISSVEKPTPLQEVLKNPQTTSIVASRIAIAMLTFGFWREVVQRSTHEASDDLMQRDMQLLASIAGNQKALQAVALSRQMERLDHYSFLDVPRAATRTQILLKVEQMQKSYDPAEYPPAAREAVFAIRKRIDEAAHLLAETDRRHAYDELLDSRFSGSSHRSIQQQAARRSLARQNYAKADEHFIKGDYYSAIVLLQQAAKFDQNNAKIWHLLGLCQKHNPNWRRAAADSFQRALSLDPKRMDTRIALGDLYLEQGMLTRARNFYEDVLDSEPENELARARLKKADKKESESKKR